MKRFYKFLLPLVAIVAMAMPWNARAQMTVTIGDGGTNTNSYLPTYELYNYSLTQQIYTAAEIGMAGTINSISFYTGGSTTRTLAVYMINTTTTGFSGSSAWITPTAADQVFSGSVTYVANGWTTLTLTNPFFYDGTSNLAVIVDDNTGSWVSSVSKRVFTPTAGGNCAIRIYSDGTNYDALAPTSYSGTTMTLKNQIQLDITPANLSCYPVRRLSVSAINPDLCTLTWSDTSNSGATYYIIDRSDSTVLGTTTDTTYTIMGLYTDTTYHLGVFVDCGGGDSSMIAGINVTTPPACPQPTNLTVDTVTSTEITISWTAGYQETEWLLAIGDSLVDVSTNPYTITDLTPNTIYTLRLRALCDAGDTSAYIQVSTRTDCENGSCNIIVYAEDGYGDGWNGNAINVMQAGVQMGSATIIDGSNDTIPIQVCDGVPVTLTFTEGNYPDEIGGIVVDGGGSIIFTISNMDNLSDGATLATVAEPCPDCIAPAGLTVDTTAPTEITVHWDAGSASEWILGVGDSLIEGISTNSFTITDLEQYTLYSIVVYAICDNGDTSAASLPVTARTTVTCPAPVALAVDTTRPTEIDVHWRAVGDETEWAITIGDSMITNITDTFYSITGLEQYTLYSIRVRAVCDMDDTSFYSNTVSARTTVSCPWPTNFTVNVSGDTANFSWNAGNASAWELVFDAPGFSPSNSPNIITLNDSTYQATLTDTGFYEAYVRAVCGGEDGISAWTGPVSFSYGVTIMNMATSGTDTLRSCAAIVYDNGGPSGSYASNCQSTLVILPSSNDREVYISGTSYTEGSYDYLTIYDGVGTSGTVLFCDNTSGQSTTLSFGPFTGTAFTVVFHSDGSVTYDGFQINVGCLAAANCPRPAAFAVNSVQADSVVASWIGNGAGSWELVIGAPGFNPDTVTAPIVLTDSSYVFNNLNGGVAYEVYVRADCSGEYSNWAGPVSFIPGQFIMGTAGSATISMCGGVIYDDGGATGQYSTNVDYTVTIYPSAPDSMLTYHGTFSHETCCDHLYIYEGVGTTGTLLWSDPGDVTTETIPLDTCISGPITVRFYSDGSITNGGLELFISCVGAPDCSPVEAITAYTTPNSALITWQPGFYGVYSGAEIEYKADTADTAAWITLPAVTGTSTVITGLEPATLYNVRVSTNCDGYIGGTATANFTTKNFGCAVIDTTSSHSDTIGTGTTSDEYFPTYSCYNYSISQQIFTATELGAGGSLVSMSMMPYDVLDANRAVQIYIGHVPASTTPSDFIYPADLTLVYSGTTALVNNQWYTFTLNDPFIYNGTDNLLVMFLDNTGSWDCSNEWYVHTSTTTSYYDYNDDDPYYIGYTGGYSSSYRNNTIFNFLSCQQQATCAAPAPAVVDVTTTTASLVWAPGTNETAWNVYYRMSGEANWSAPVAVTTNSHTVTGLVPGRPYEFKVETTCSEGTFAATTSATTLCAAVTLPFTEDFNGWGTGHLPNCWFNTGSYSGTGNINGSQNMSGTTGGSVYMYCSSGTTYLTRLILPELDSAYQMNQTQLVFNVKYTSTSYGAPRFAVGVMSDPNNPSTIVFVDTVSVTGGINQWEVFEVSLAGYTGNGAHAVIQTVYPGNYFYCYLDEVTLEQIPTCPRPDSLTAGNSTTTTVDLAWHERASASEWVIEYGPRGFQLGTGTQVVVNTNPYTLTGLAPSYQGEYYVKSICGMGDTGEYSRRSCAFATTQIPATLPYSYNFEDSTEWANWQTCSYNNTNWYRGTAIADSGMYSMYISVDSGATYSPYQYNSVVNATAFRDVDFGPVDSSFTMTIRSRAGGSTDGAYDGLIVLLADPSIPTVPSSVNLMTPWGDVRYLYQIMGVHADTNWQTYTCSFDTIHGVQRVAFYWVNQNTQSSHPTLTEPVAVDNITIDYSSCPRPVDVDTVHVGGSSATLSWVGDASATYEVIYRVAGASAATNVYVTTPTNSITLSGLNGTTTYHVWVRRLCGVGDTSLVSDGIAFTTTMCDGAEMYANDSVIGTGTSGYSPIGYSFYNYSYVQTIIDSAVMAQFGGDITAFGFQPASTSAGTYFTNMDVYMANVSESSLSNGFIHPDSNHTFVHVISNGDFSYSTTDWQYHSFDTVFTWDGHSNVVFAVNRQHGSYSSGSSFKAHSATAGMMRYVYNDGSAYDINTVSGGYATATSVGDIMLVSCSAGCRAPIVSPVTTFDYESATINVSGNNAIDYELSYGTDISNPTTTMTSTTGIFNLTGLTPNTTYYFHVIQHCEDSSASPATDGFFTTEALPCFAVSNLHVAGTSYNSVDLTWNAGGEESAWEVKVFSTVDTVSVTVMDSSATVNGLVPQRGYSAIVRPMCGNNHNIEGPWGDTVSFNTDACQPVTNVTVNPSATTATVSWTAPEGATSFRVAYGLDGFTIGGEIGIYNVTSNPFELTELEPETPYTVQVANVCTETLISAWAQADFTTLQGDGIADIDAEGNISLFPNPASTMVTIVSTLGNAEVTVVDLNGRTVVTLSLENGSATFDVSQLAKGAYFVRLTGEQATTVRKLIVK